MKDWLTCDHCDAEFTVIVQSGPGIKVEFCPCCGTDLSFGKFDEDEYDDIDVDELDFDD